MSSLFAFALGGCNSTPEIPPPLGEDASLPAVDPGGHLLLTPQGLAKIGQLILNEGRWNGDQIVDAEWINASSSVQTRVDGQGYGYLWWIHDISYGNISIRAIAARGNGG